MSIDEKEIQRLQEFETKTKESNKKSREYHAYRNMFNKLFHAKLIVTAKNKGIDVDKLLDEAKAEAGKRSGYNA